MKKMNFFSFSHNENRVPTREKGRKPHGDRMNRERESSL
jgi:hypothetical protein